MGGGWTGQFNLQGWDTVKIEVLELLTNSNVQFAWSSEGLENGNQDLFLPESVDTGVPLPVPNGAYAILVEDPTGGVPTTLAWETILTAGFTDIVTTFAGGPLYGQPIPTKGTLFSVIQAGAATVDVVWLLRPI